MTFDFQTLDMTGIGMGGGPKYGTYDAGADTIAAVETNGYFDSAARELNSGDILVVKASNATRAYLLTVVKSPADVALGDAPNVAAAVAAVANADAADLASVILVANECKAQFNALRTAMRASGTLA